MSFIFIPMFFIRFRLFKYTWSIREPFPRLHFLAFFVIHAFISAAFAGVDGSSSSFIYWHEGSATVNHIGKRFDCFVFGYAQIIDVEIAHYYIIPFFRWPVL